MKNYTHDLPNEIWKTIPEFEGLYEISNLGRIKGLLKNTIRKTDLTYKGYERILLCKSNQLKITRLVHRLVAQAFIPNPENKPEVNHLNGIKNDNRIANLEWTTGAENRQHAVEVLGYTPEYFRKLTRDHMITNPECYTGYKK